MTALRAISSAFRQASQRQKAVIIVAALVIVGAIVNGSPPSGSPAPVLVAPTSPLIAVASAPMPHIDVPASASLPTPSATSTPEPSPTATPTATPTPTAKPTPRPTPVPTPKPSTFSLSFTSLTTPIYPNQYATAKVKTAASAYCTIDVEYKSGPSTAAGLGPKTANSSGVASWTWKVGGRTTPGSWPVTVTCSQGGASKSVTRDLDVL